MNLRPAAEKDHRIIKKVYGSAFPANERAPFFFIRRRALQDRAEMLVAEEDGEFIGFVYIVSHGDLIYLFYFAVAEDKRGGGNGSEILRLLKEYYSGKTLFLARESLDETADNSRERIARRNFYLRNGFVDLPCRIREASVVYDVMSTGENISPADYRILIRNWAGKFVLRFVKMELFCGSREPNAKEREESGKK